MVFHGDLMVFHGDLMVFHGDLTGFNGDLMMFNGTEHNDSMDYEWDIPSGVISHMAGKSPK